MLRVVVHCAIAQWFEVCLCRFNVQVRIPPRAALLFKRAVLGVVDCFLLVVFTCTVLSLDLGVFGGLITPVCSYILVARLVECLPRLQSVVGSNSTHEKRAVLGAVDMFALPFYPVDMYIHTCTCSASHIWQ